MDGFDDGEDGYDDANYAYMEDTYIEAVCLNNMFTGRGLITNASLYRMI